MHDGAAGGVEVDERQPDRPALDAHERHHRLARGHAAVADHDADDVRRAYTTYVLEDPNAPWARNWKVTCRGVGWPGTPRHPDPPRDA